MVDPWGFIKNVLDAHGAWILGGAIVANLAHTANKKSKSFKRAVEWDYVKCIGCGRGGYSDEMRSGSDASGKNHFSCARCSRPDLFKQAEGDDQPQPTTDWQESGILTHSYPGDSTDAKLLYYLDWDSEDPYPTLPCIYCRTNLELFRVEKKISWDGKPYEHLIYKCNPCCLSTKSAEEDSSKPCSHCDGTASFPREFYYQADRIEMVPCGTCITQGRCPGCMEIYPNLSRSNQPEDVFLGSGCERCGYTEADARAARKTARRWADLVDNPAAAKFMAEGDAPKVSPKASIQSFIDYEEQRTSNSPCDCHVCVDREPDDETKCYVCDYKYPFKTMVMFHGIEGVEAKCKDCFTNAQTVTRHCPSCGGLSCGQQYGLPPYAFHTNKDGIYTTGTPYFLPISYTEECSGWCESMSAESYDSDTHGKTLPLGSVKRFLTTIPRGQMFHVEFVKSNGDIRPMDAFFNKPYQPDSNTANVMEVTGSGKASFKRFRVDRVVSIYRI